MRSSNTKLIVLLWSVIIVLVLGGTIGAMMMVHKANDLTTTNDELTSQVSSLRSQLDEAQAIPTPTPTPVATPVPTPVPTPEVTPKPTPTPKAKTR